jgi:TrmH family RNA methyltransferase
MNLANLKIVLVRPHYPGNIGAAARACANFAAGPLVLVDPVADPLSHQARMMAAGGVDRLDHMIISNTLSEAVADCGMVLATGSEIDGTERDTVRGTPRDWLPKFAPVLASGPAAIVFGPEPHGLTTAEIGQCHGLLYLPSHDDYPSLNLSLSVGIVLYLLFEHDAAALARPPAPFAEFDRAAEHLHRALTDVRFLFGQNADTLMHGVRHLLARSLPTEQEVKMLHGLAKQIEYVAQKLPSPNRNIE